MNYLDLPIPKRSEHLWRYTSWKRVHPTKVDTLPSITSATVSVNGLVISPNSTAVVTPDDDISRVFLAESNNQMHKVVINDDNNDLSIQINSEDDANSCHIHFEAKVSASVRISLTGNSKWFGLKITGELGQNVNLSYGIVNDMGDDTTILRCEDWQVSRDSTLEYGELSAGGERIKSDIRTYLSGVNSSLMQNIAVNCQATSVDDHHIEIHHLSGHSNSSLTVKSACADRSHAIGTGLLVIEEDCDKSDAGQVFKNLLLSERAKAESIPELEVLSDDVSAAHGAASSSVDPEQIHYLMARGFSREDATSEIVEGFLISSFAKIANQQTREFLINSLSNLLD